MEEQELKDIWIRSSANEDITINNNKLMSNFKSKMERRERIVRRRDLKETILAIIGIALYSIIIYKKPNSVSIIGAILMILSMIHVVVRLYNNRKSKFTQNLFLPIKEQLLQQRAFMLSQAKLLRNVFWLFLPVFISYLIFEWGDSVFKIVNASSLEFGLIKNVYVKVITTLFMILVGFYITIQNKRAAKVNWEPLIKDIDLIIENLDKEK